MGKYEKPNVCPHNEMVACTTAKCERCGWNPTVTQQRLEEIANNLCKQKEVKK